MTTAWTTDLATQDAARAVRLTLLWGLDGVALRTLGGGRVPAITEGPLRRRLREADLPVLALDPGLFESGARARWLDDLDALGEVAAFGRRMGCSLVRVGALAVGAGGDAADALRQAGDRADALGLRLAVRNEAGTAVATGASLAALLAQVGHPAVGADWRPADALASGEDPADGRAALAAATTFCVGADAVPDAVDWPRQLAGLDVPVVIDALPDPARTSGLGVASELIGHVRASRS